MASQILLASSSASAALCSTRLLPLSGTPAARSSVPTTSWRSLPSLRRASPSLPRHISVRRHAIECSQYKGKFPYNPRPVPPPSPPPESLFAILANTHTLLPLALAVAVPLISGSIVALAASPLQEWYAGLQRPWFQPPDWLFGATWSLLYPIMGVASFLVWREGGWAAQRGPLLLYGTQLLVNLAWPVVFFKMHRIGAALGVIALLLLLACLTLLSFATVSPLASALFLPYVLWVAFATALNLALWFRNKGNTPGRGGGGGGGGKKWGEGGGGGGGWGGDDGDGGQGVSVKVQRGNWGSVVVSRALSFVLGRPAAAHAASTNSAATASLSRKQQRQRQRQQDLVVRQSEYKGYSLGALNIAPVGTGKPRRSHAAGVTDNSSTDRDSTGASGAVAGLVGATAGAVRWA
ncbi:unnamed protein product [Closterium sp. NIES-64]|nr:unnamed protein product [Closterium sp. NIES-64]